MTQEEPVERPKHRWLAWMGLQAPPTDPDAWVPVASGRVSDPTTGASDFAKAIAQTLADAGIEAHQRPYVVPASLAGLLTLGGASASDRVRVAVLVHARDEQRARPLVGAAHEPDPGASQPTERQAASLLKQAVPPVP